MIKLVIIINSLIALGGFYLAWNLWKLGGILGELNQNLQELEGLTEELTKIPLEIKIHRQNLRKARQDYEQLQRQLGRLQQFLALVSWGRIIWNYYHRKIFWRKTIV